MKLKIHFKQTKTTSAGAINSPNLLVISNLSFVWLSLICIFLFYCLWLTVRPSSTIRPVRPWPKHFFDRAYKWPYLKAGPLFHNFISSKLSPLPRRSNVIWFCCSCNFFDRACLKVRKYHGSHVLLKYRDLKTHTYLVKFVFSLRHGTCIFFNPAWNED